MRRVFVGLIRDHRTKIGRIRAIRKLGFSYGSENKVKDSKG